MTDLPWWVSWATAALTIACAWMTRRLYWQGYVIGLVNQALWTWLVVKTAQWGLLVVGAFMIYNYSRGILEWRAKRVERLR